MKALKYVTICFGLRYNVIRKKRQHIVWKIGDIEIDNQIVVAPMAGVTNSAFRTITKEFGAGLVVCEMISDKALIYGNEKTLRMLHIEENEYPLSIQIMGGEAETMVKAAQFIERETDAAIIDINMGCPVPKITKNDSGSKLLLDPDNIYDLVSRVVDAVDIPVTVKMRTGWDDDHYWPIKNALAAERAGAKMLAMHGRTRLQMYEGTADWDILGQVKEAIDIPFVANGDIKTPADVDKALEVTGADALMVGRAALGNPWVVKQLTHYLDTGEILDDPTPTEIIQTAKDHLHRLVDLKGEHTAVKEFRKHASYYLKGFPGSAKAKVKVNEQTEADKMTQVLDQAAIQAEEKIQKRLARRRARQAENQK